MIGEFKLVHLVGSTRGNEKVFSLIEKELTKAGFIVFKPVFYIKEDYMANKEVLDKMCYEKLVVVDIVCIVGKEYIGKSTRNRIQQAISMGKEVMIWNKDKMIKYEIVEE